MEALICPRCGKKSTQKEFIEAFCIDCYPLNITLPKDVYFDTCKRCSKFRFGNDWRLTDEAELSKIIVRKCKGEFSQVDYDFQTGMLVFTIERRSKRFTIEKPFRVITNVTMCPQCSRMSGGYFEGILQLRGDKNKVDKYSRAIQKRLVEKSFISKVEVNRDGTDIYFGSTPAAVTAIGELGLTYKITKKLFGMKEGKNVYRSTILVRFEEKKNELPIQDD